MARVADYVTLTDTTFDLVEGQFYKVGPFSMPVGFSRGSRSILFFTLLLPGASTLDLRLYVNSNEYMWRGVFSGDSEFHSVHELLNANTLNQDDNSILFAADAAGSDISASNPVRIGDVFVLCQANI
jgi:hypothetical protein